MLSVKQELDLSIEKWLTMKKKVSKPRHFIGPSKEKWLSHTGSPRALIGWKHVIRVAWLLYHEPIKASRFPLLKWLPVKENHQAIKKQLQNLDLAEQVFNSPLVDKKKHIFPLEISIFYFLSDGSFKGTLITYCSASFIDHRSAIFVVISFLSVGRDTLYLVSLYMKFCHWKGLLFWL